MSIKAYQAVQDKVTDPRRIEIMVFQRCNALMSAAASARSHGIVATDPLAAIKGEAQALFEHDRLWISLLADLATDENQMPAPLRARLISLGLWSCRYTDRVRQQQAPFEPLIELNNQMIAGLTDSLQANRNATVEPAAPFTHTDAPIVT